MTLTSYEKNLSKKQLLMVDDGEWRSCEKNKG